jgi:hypothetical protein
LKVNALKSRIAGSKDSIKRVLSSPFALPTVSALMLICSAAPAFSAVIDIQVAPPAPRVVEAPAPRPGYAWAPGYWRWDGHQHVWVDGRWLRERPHQHWVAEHWDEHGGRYHFEPGHWVHD